MEEKHFWQCSGKCRPPNYTFKTYFTIFSDEASSQSLFGNFKLGSKPTARHERSVKFILMSGTVKPFQHQVEDLDLHTLLEIDDSFNQL